MMAPKNTLIQYKNITQNLSILYTIILQVLHALHHKIFMPFQFFRPRDVFQTLFLPNEYIEIHFSTKNQV